MGAVPPRDIYIEATEKADQLATQWVETGKLSEGFLAFHSHLLSKWYRPK